MTSRDSLPRGLILQHEIFTKTLDGHLLRVPVTTTPSINRVLDIGTGCGIWAADFAAAHPWAEVIGIDNFSQPNIAAPPNCRFLALDAEQDWDELGVAKFDVIHTRLVPFHVGELPGVLRRCYEHLNPGGWIEMQEACPPCRTDEPAGAPEHRSKVIEWMELRAKAAAKIGIDQGIPERLPQMLSEAGFVDLSVEDHKWPIGPWMEDEKTKEVGEIYLELLRFLMSRLSKELLANLGMREDEVEDFLEQVKGQLGVGKIYTPVRIVWARKPR